MRRVLGFGFGFRFLGKTKATQTQWNGEGIEREGKREACVVCVCTSTTHTTAMCQCVCVCVWGKKVVMADLKGWNEMGFWGELEGSEERSGGPCACANGANQWRGSFMGVGSARGTKRGWTLFGVDELA